MKILLDQPPKGIPFGGGSGNFPKVGLFREIRLGILPLHKSNETI